MNKFVKIALAVALAAVMCVSAVADTAVPSIAQKTDISLVSYIVYDSNGNEVGDDSTMGSIVVTPYAERATLSADKQADIEAAYSQILGADTLTELVSHLPEDTVALYLFDISAYDEAADQLNAGGTADVTLECDLGNYSEVIVLHNYEGSHWEEKDSTVLSSTQVQTTINSCSPYVVAVTNTVTVTEAVEGGIVDNGVDVSGVASSSTMPYVLGGVACIVVAGALLIVANKKKVK
ncbi:MAG: hypothetical protein LUG49_03115 [Oscillospiraceae bacterium]|nr:hypothetical protein [Oscillospiraceae bacterium]